MGAAKKHCTYQWRIIHAQYHYALMLGAVLRPPPNMCFNNVASIQERHLSVTSKPYVSEYALWNASRFAVRFDPHLVPSMRCHDVQCCDM
jgi:hypothetical protein